MRDKPTAGSSRKMQPASPNTSIGRQGTLQTHNIALPGKYSPIQKQLTYKCIVNNAENIKAPATLTSLKYTKNWLQVHYNIVTHAALHTWTFVHGCFRGKMHSGFTEFKVDGSMQKEVGYWYPIRLEKTIWKWDVCVCPAGHERVNGRQSSHFTGHLKVIPSYRSNYVSCGGVEGRSWH